MDDLISVECSICKRNNFKIAMKVDGFNLVRCMECGLVYANPRLKKEDIYARYSEDYFRNEYIPKVTGYYLANKNTYDGLLKEFSLYKRKGLILDIGCGTGNLLNSAEKQGWTGLGLEISRYASEYAINKFGVNVKTGDIYSVEVLNNQFDVVTMIEVLEHMTDPLIAVKKAASFLRPGGLLYITTPNFIGIGRLLLRSKAVGLWPREHLYYFTPKSIARLMQAAGIKVVSISTIGVEEENIKKFLNRWLFTYFWSKSKNGKAAIEINPVSIKKSFKSSKIIINSLLNKLKIGDKIILCAEK
jgi:2-polyprenyl-3-methyl-5-hydroxy-6-metoxy-1,4-benzoquinol methylase